MPEEPVLMSSLGALGAALTQFISHSNLQDPLTWQSGDDLRIVPTTATVGWEQMDADTWRFELRQGVKFHNGEPWNAEAALPSLGSLGKTGELALVSPPSGSINYTGPFTAEAVDEFTLDINCDDPCPIFPSTAFFVNFEAPKWLLAASEEDRARQSIGIGPYKHVAWEPGVSITQEAYEDYVPAGDHFEFQKPLIEKSTWLWRGEPLVIAAMVQAGEADIGWDITVDGVGGLPENMIKFGSSAETYALTVNNIWHPELKKKKVRQAMAHAINCQELVDSLYAGKTTCRGNIIWPGIIGASESNTAPYEFNPDLSRRLLEEAGYNRENKITISARAARVAKQVEVNEALIGYWDRVGMSVDLQVVESAIRSALTRCGAGKATEEILQAAGKDPKTSKPTMEDFQAAVDKGRADCPTGDLIGNQPSNETLDFGRQVNYYMNCVSIRSLVCDLGPGGAQEQIPEALAASGQERQQRLEKLADKLHDDVMLISLFDLPIIYVVDPKLNFTPRLDPNIRVNTMWFSP
jgi:ABC-type transport system substrate-binding protein